MSKQVAKAVALAGLSASLYGCGPAPAYAPKTVGEAWQNHFDAFGTVDVPKIMKDYTEESVLSIFFEKCDGQSGTSPSHQGFEEYKGKVAIQKFFEGLFKQLKQSLADSQVAVTGPDTKSTPAPFVVEDTNGIAGANVFLTWTAVAADPVINWATDSFSFKKGDDGVFTIHKQNIVASVEAACADSKSVSGTSETKIDDLTTLNPCGSDTAGLCGAWNNHFASFGGQNLTTMMYDYLPTSTVQIWDAQTKKLDGTYVGLQQIEGMFAGLFQTLGSPAAGLDVKLLEVDEATRTVFLVWVSDGVPKATDTFIFDENHKIITQNIQVVSSASQFIV